MSFETEGHGSKHNDRSTLFIVIQIVLLIPFIWIPIVLIIDLLSLIWVIAAHINKTKHKDKNIFTDIWQPYISGSLHKDEYKNIISWWERRRTLYTITAETTVIISFVLFFIFIMNSGVLQPGEDAVEPMMLIASALIFPIIINIFYTLGWIVELLLLKKHVRNERISSVLFMTGTIFTLICVAFPAIYWGLYCLIRLFIK